MDWIQVYYVVLLTASLVFRFALFAANPGKEYKITTNAMLGYNIINQLTILLPITGRMLGWW